MLVKTTISMPSDLAKKVKTYCKDNGYTVSGLIKVVLIQYLRDHEQ